ncbi:deoxynucleoside kinase [Candidatus Azambacteria bacterium]|nr:deoxynucleoside kinase [Candidatus Azambacteria bacterium]
MMGKESPFFWINIEGTDGVGKTTISRKLRDHLQELYPNEKFILFNEFSNFEIGKIIKRVIKKEKFFKLNSNTHYPLAETLMLVTDLMCQFEAEVFSRKSRKKVYIISDRGPHSFLTYQLIRLNDFYPQGKWKKWVEDILRPFGRPDLSIFLVSDIGEIKNRLIKRGDDRVLEDLQFITKIQSSYINLAKKDKKSFVLKNKNNALQRTVDDATQIVKQYLLGK